MAKFSLVPFVILSMLSITISSCKDDEEESIPTPEIQQQSKKLVGVKTYDENNLYSTTTYSYNPNGKVSEKKVVFETEKIGSINHTDKYEYNGDSVTIREETKDYSVIYTCITNSNGYFTSMINSSEYDTYEYSWEYSENHCTSHTYSSKSELWQSTWNFEFTWNDDDMESVKMDYIDEYGFRKGPFYHVYSNQNGEMIANKGGIGINLLSLTTSDIFEPGILHGYNSAHLPIGVYADDINNMSDLHWVINEDGYPLKVSIDTTITYEFTWE